MSGKYLPPHLRRPPSPEKAHTGSISHRTYCYDDITEVFGFVMGKRGTLNAVVGGKQDILAFMLLFTDQSCRNHNSQGEIYTRSNLQLLHSKPLAAKSPEDPFDSSSVSASAGDPSSSFEENTSQELTMSDAEFPVFVAKGNGPRDRFKCLGWHRLSSVSYVEPRTAALVDVLDQKFGPHQRLEENWKQSLNVRWAVVKVEKIAEREGDDPMEPVRRKSVNELLKDLRLSGTEEGTISSENDTLRRDSGSPPSEYSTPPDGRSNVPKLWEIETLMKERVTKEGTDDTSGGLMEEAVIVSSSSPESWVEPNVKPYVLRKRPNRSESPTMREVSD
ncbi:hypothetical protein MMC20_007368 [Loxospora ochrophaea]|nr:hypothetical protein [Loxospora ochrophaea]